MSNSPGIPEEMVDRMAKAAVHQAKTLTVLKHYRQVVQQFAMLFHRHGLGQTLAFLKLQGGDRQRSPYSVLATQLDGWLQGAMSISGKDSLVVLGKRDSRFYREAAEQTWRFVRALGSHLENTS